MQKRYLTCSIFCFLCLCWMTATFAGTSNRLTGLRISAGVPTSRFVLEFSKKPDYSSFFIQHPDRFVVDLKATTLGTALDLPSILNTPVKEIRGATREKKDLRLVFDLKEPVVSKVLSLEGKRHRLVVDLTSNHTSKTTPKLAVTIPKTEKTRDVVVVIDPGHGGKDPGATGQHGTHEKNVVLAIGKDLAARLNHEPGFRAVLTRTRDHFITLRGRLDIARRDKADMFVAIHADAYINRRAEGASVYALSEHGATSEAARWLAQKENESELGQVDLSAYKSNILRSVLIDLAQTATIGASLSIGQSVLHELHAVTRLHHSIVEQAAFVVLKSPDIPSLLVETGFISNRQEEKRLQNPAYQYSLAKAIAVGIEQYFIRRPPRGTWLSVKNKQKGITHVVSPGETLSGIAANYHTSMKKIQTQNHMKNDRVFVGEKLDIVMG